MKRTAFMRLSKGPRIPKIMSLLGVSTAVLLIGVAPAMADGSADSTEAELAKLKATVEVLKNEVASLKSKVNDDAGKGRKKPAIEFHTDLHNLFLFRNDRDFDRIAPAYNANGQSVGAFATVLAPTIAWNLNDDIKIFYEAEIGLNYWSKNNPDQEDALADDVFVLKHRQIFAEGALLDGALGFKVGYQYFSDTTGLFMGHWMGVAQMWGSWAPGSKVGVFVGMVPDQTYEGINIDQNNFEHDIFMFGARADLKLTECWKLDIAIHNLYDTHVVDKRRWMAAPNFNLSVKSKEFGHGMRAYGALGGVLQIGNQDNSAISADGTLGDQQIFAWATQMNFGLDLKSVDLRLNFMALSGDDAHADNNHNGAFTYSSKSTSATVYLTEDEIRNWYDQLDRRMGRFEGGFWQNRAGLAITDLKATLTMLDWFKPAIIFGNTFVINPDNALGERNVGYEMNLDMRFVWEEYLQARFLVGGMLPREAASIVNLTQPGAKETDPVWWTEVALSLKF